MEAHGQFIKKDCLKGLENDLDGVAWERNEHPLAKHSARLEPALDELVELPGVERPGVEHFRVCGIRDYQ